MTVTAVSNYSLSMSAHDEALKTTKEVALQLVLLCQVLVGTVVNIILFVHNFSPVLTGIQMKPTQTILSHMAVANTLILLMTMSPNNVMVFASRTPLTDLRCKLEYFLRLVARSINMCSTSVLSTYQFVTLVPGNWGRVTLRGRVAILVRYSCYTCWFFSVINNVYIPMKVTGPQKTANDTLSKNNFACSTSGFGLGIVFLCFIHDAIFITIMSSTSISMLHLLHRHYRQMHHILAPIQDHRVHAETRAAHTILMLVVTFVSFYLLNFIWTIFHSFLTHSRLWLRHLSEVLAISFPTISPFLLILRDPKDPCTVLFCH